jgi:hypothetical protein
VLGVEIVDICQVKVLRRHQRRPHCGTGMPGQRAWSTVSPPASPTLASLRLHRRGYATRLDSGLLASPPPDSLRQRPESNRARQRDQPSGVTMSASLRWRVRQHHGRRRGVLRSHERRPHCGNQGRPCMTVPDWSSASRKPASLRQLSPAVVAADDRRPPASRTSASLRCPRVQRLWTVPVVSSGVLNAGLVAAGMTSSAPSGWSSVFRCPERRPHCGATSCACVAFTIMSPGVLNVSLIALG